MKILCEDITSRAKTVAIYSVLSGITIILFNLIFNSLVKSLAEFCKYIINIEKSFFTMLLLIMCLLI